MTPRSIHPLRSPQLFRTLVHLHSGKRVAGLKRNPEEYLKVGEYSYGTSPTNLQFVKSFLGERFELSDEVALQTLTHKSFAHGLKPYNEKLAYLGAKFLDVRVKAHLIAAPASGETTIGGLNFNALNSPVSRQLGLPATRYLFAKAHDLTKVLFWTARDKTIENPLRSGQIKVTNDAVCALVGAVLLHKGEAVALEFVAEKLLGGDHSLLVYAEKCVSALEKAQ